MWSLSLCTTWKHGMNGGIAPLVLKLGTSFTPRPFYPRGKSARCVICRRLDGRIKLLAERKMCNKWWISAEVRCSVLCYNMQPVPWAGQMFPGSCSPPLPVPINPPCPPPDILLKQLNYPSHDMPPLAWTVSAAEVGSGVPNYCNPVCDMFITLLWGRI